MSVYAFTTLIENNEWDKIGKKFLANANRFLPKDSVFLLQFTSQDNQQRILEEAAQISMTQNKAYCSFGFKKDQLDAIEKSKDKPEAMKVFSIHNSYTSVVCDFVVFVDSKFIFNRPMSKERLSDIAPGVNENYLRYQGFEIYKFCPETRKEIIDSHNKCLKGDFDKKDFINENVLNQFASLYVEDKDFNINTSMPAYQDRAKMTQINIQTKNCVDSNMILNHISNALKQTNKWVDAALKRTDEEIVICSAGPTLDPEEVRPFYEKGYKIVAVKHALRKLLDAGIKPWACVLLDPRKHVADFITPDIPKDVIFFVASMCHPEVYERLNKYGLNVYGYHALVGAGEEKILEGKFGISGGSGSTTRGISLLDCLGFHKFHMFGFDCCYLQKPDFSLLKPGTNESLYWEIDIDVPTEGNKTLYKTIWTEAELFAQISEFRNIYLQSSDFVFYTYGEGIISFIHKHHRKWSDWFKKVREETDKQRLSSVNIERFLAIKDLNASNVKS